VFAATGDQTLIDSGLGRILARGTMRPISRRWPPLEGQCHTVDQWRERKDPVIVA
jgi:hypothetical protein